jgi:spermidine/putrescine transport system permease protein
VARVRDVGGERLIAPPATIDQDALELSAKKADARRGLLIALPSYIYLVLFFALPFGIVFIYSFATRSRTGRTVLEGWNFDSYARLGEPIVREIAVRSLTLAIVTTAICLIVSYPFAYFIATRGPTARNILLVLVMIPFWSNFLVRTYAWRVLLGSSGPMSQISQFFGGEEIRVLFTNTAVLIGLVYGYMPFMVLPLYASLERMDWNLVEAARDLYASSWTAFRRITLPLSMPGVVAGSILVFIPSLGAYVTPALLGGARTTLLGDYIVGQFLSARNWPYGSALSVAVMIVMLFAALFYFRVGAKST